MGGTTGGDLPNTTDDFASDALEAVSFLKKQRNIDVSSIGLLGHSEGGAIAFIAANRSSEISFIVSLASPGMSGKKIALEQLGQGLLNKETDTITVNNVLKFWDRSFDIITEARSGAGSVKFQITNVFKEWLMEFTDSPRSITLMGFDPAKLDDDTLVDEFLKSKMMVYLNPWYRYFLSYDPRQLLSNIKIPILALNGDKDQNVNADLNLSRFESLAREFGLSVDIVKMQNINHFLQTSSDRSITKVYGNQETVSPEMLSIIFEWINKNK